MTDSTDVKLIEAEQLTRHYGAIRAVDNVSFTLNKGEVLGFLGPNGAGKSTTMQMLCGALAPTSGSIKISGIDLLEEPLQAKQAIGYLPETPPLYRELTVNEYLHYCAKIRRVSEQDRPDAVELAKKRCGIAHVSDRLIGNLSKGYQQRVGIAQAIAHSPRVVILDEPTVGLDPIQIREIRTLIRELGNDHGVILSTHILPEVQMTCDRVQIIHQGQLVFNASIDDLNAHMQTSSLTIQLRIQPKIDELAKIDGVNEVESLGDDKFRIHFTIGQSPAELVAKACVSNDWGLLEMTPDVRSLENIFVNITSRELTADVEQQAGAE